MRIAFAYWKDRIAPVFDTARFLRLVDVENHRVIAQSEEVLGEDLPQGTMHRLVDLKVDTLVCGAISRQLEVAIATSGIEVVPFVAGDVETVIEAFLGRRLWGDSFKMPGCCGRLRRRGQGGRCGRGGAERPLPGWRTVLEESGMGAAAPPVGAECRCDSAEGGASLSPVPPAGNKKE